MSNWQNHTPEDQKLLLQQTSDQEGINPVAIEKDWWVTVTLKALFQTSCADYLLFKGGTSLSKGWNLIERFSEDVDLALDHSFLGIHGINKSQRDKLRKNSRKYIHETLSKELGEQLDTLGVTGYSIKNVVTVNTNEGEKAIDSDKDPTVILLDYVSVLDSQIAYIPPRVKIEISCLSMSEPSEMKEITSLINNHYPDEDEGTTSWVKTVLPTRTFLEKIFLLNEEFQKEQSRSRRMSRHLYDIEKLMDTEFGREALKESKLYEDIVKHRYDYYAVKYIDYQKHHPSVINFCPPDKVKKEWMVDYDEMRHSFIYGEALSFDELLARMEELLLRLRVIKTKENLLE